MKTKPPLSLVTAFFALIAASASAQNFSSATVNGSDITKYRDDGGELFLAPTANPTDLLQGNAAAPGGNIELFASSDSGIYHDLSEGGAFASVTPTSITANFSPSGVVTVRSLNGNDWFLGTGGYDTNYGADNLANTWFHDFLAAVKTQGPTSAAFINGNEENLFNQFRDNGGFPQASDPNISYVEFDSETEVATVGLGGFMDGTDRYAQLLGLNGNPFLLAAFKASFPNGLQISEVAMVNERPVYSFSATPSGTYLNDGVDSYDGNYEASTPPPVAVPEPSTIFLAVFAGTSVIFRRRR